jgi:hypothetical protein
MRKSFCRRKLRLPEEKMLDPGRRRADIAA